MIVIMADLPTQLLYTMCYKWVLASLDNVRVQLYTLRIWSPQTTALALNCSVKKHIQKRENCRWITPQWPTILLVKCRLTTLYKKLFSSSHLSLLAKEIWGCARYWSTYSFCSSLTSFYCHRMLDKYMKTGNIRQNINLQLKVSEYYDI